MTISAYEEIAACPRRWALSAAEYPELWKGRGYPPKLQVHAVRGSAIHLAVEIITKKLILAGCVSVRDPRAATVLKQLGGYTKIISDCIQRVLKRFSENPRGVRLLDSVDRTLRGQTPDLRMRVQSILARLRLPPFPQAQDHTEAAFKGRRPLTIGAYPELELRAPRIRWKGKADLLVITNDDCEIIDFKTGVPDEAHRFQVQVYALLWSLDDEINPTHRIASRLVLAYPSGDVEVGMLSQEQLSGFENELAERRKSAEAALAVRPPEARPTPQNCRYCGVRHLCDAYWARGFQDEDRPSGGAGFGDAEVKILRRHGPMSFDAVLESSGGGDVGRSALVRVQESLELTAGRRFRILDAGIAVGPDDVTQPAIVTVTMFSEIFAVG